METLVYIEDKPLKIEVTLSFLNSYVYNQGVFMRDNNLSTQSFELLILVLNYYNDTGKGLSCTKMLQLSSFSVRYYHKIYSMLETLNKNGLVEYMGNGYLNCKLFAPTSKAIDGINTLVSSITV